MNIAELTNEGLKRAYRVTVPAADLAARVDKAVAEVAPQVRMPGFRPGKVPANLVRKMHGANLRADAVRDAANEAVQALLRDNNLRPATQPDVDLESGTEEGQDLALTVNLEVLPAIDDVKADDIQLEKLVVPADDAAINEQLERLAANQKKFEDAPEGHVAADGDQVVMDYRGTVDGVAFDGGTGEGMAVELGSGNLIPGFEEQLAGATVGEARTVRVTFPADYGAKNLAGKDAEFAVTVTAVKRAVPQAVDESLATNLGLESLEKLREVLKDQVEAELSGLTRTHMKRKLLDLLAARHDFDVPPSMVQAEFDGIWAQLEQETRGDSEATTELEKDRDEYRRIAERRVRLGLLLSEIGSRAGVQVSAQETNRLVAQEAQRYPGQEQQVVKYFQENPMAAAQLRAPLFEEKVVDHLLAQASLTEREVSREELQAAIEDEDETPGVTRMGLSTPHVHGPDCDHDHDHDHHGHDHAHEPVAQSTEQPAEGAVKPKRAKKPKAESTEAPAEGADDVSPPTEGSPVAEAESDVKPKKSRKKAES